MKRRYELTVILAADLSSSDQKTTVKALEDLLEKTDGTVVKHEEWGLRDMAYSIKKQASGVYHYYEIELSPEKVKPLNQGMGLAADIVRHLLVIHGE